MSTRLHASVIGIVSCVVYSGVVWAPFLHDDNPALLKNPDVQGVSSLSEVWFHDFWGTNIKLESSHKSYRPLTILFFRLLHFIWENWAPGFHMCNIILHASVSVLFFFVCRKHVFNEEQTQASFITALLFGLHPIHTEAVCGIVGCAELLSAFCFMLALLVHSSDDYCLEKSRTEDRCPRRLLSFEEKHRKTKRGDETLRRRNPKMLDPKEVEKEASDDDRKYDKSDRSDQPKKYRSLLQHLPSLLLSLALAFVAMLCKESGITVLGVLLTCEAIHLAMRPSPGKAFFECLTARFITRSAVICLVGTAIIVLRMWIMEWKGPTFNPADNPASHQKERITRVLTYFSLAWINFGLLLFPINLCYDYSFSTIPLITSIWQGRNIISLHFLLLLIVCSNVGINLLLNKKKMLKPFVMGCSLMIFPFLPASNLFFPVGFVIAERCLYLPSAGFLVLLVLKLQCLNQWVPSFRNATHITVGGLVIIYFTLTIKRSLDWTSKERFFSSGYYVNPNNPKIIYNWANHLRENNRSFEAIEEYRKVLKIHPTYASAINNLATILEKNSSTMKEAQELYVRVIQMEPLHKNAYINLALILLKEKKYLQVTKVLIRAVLNVPISLKPATLLIREMVEQNATAEAEQTYFHMLNKVCLNPSKPHAADNCTVEHLPAMRGYADLLLKKGRKKEASRTYNKAVKINPRDADTLVGLSNVLLSTKGAEEAINMMLKAVGEDKSKVKETWEMASSLFHNKRFLKSLKLYKVVADIIPDNFDAVGQYAALLSEVGETELAEKILLNLTSRDHKCLHHGVWKNLATFYGRREKHKKAIILINLCLTRLQDRNKKEKATLLHQLGKHEKDRSKQLFENGLTKEANDLFKKSLKSLKEADDLNPENTETRIMIERMAAKN